MFALPPFVTFLSFELLTGQVKGAIRRAGVTQTTQAMSRAVDAAREDVAFLNAQADDLQARCDTLRAEVLSLQKAKRDMKQSANVPVPGDTDGGFVPGDLAALASANVAREQDKRDRQAALVSAIANKSGVTYDELAALASVSVRTIKRDIREMIEAGVITRNGHGLEVVTLGDMPAVTSYAEPVTN